jgi:putative acetyltransferase
VVIRAYDTSDLDAVIEVFLRAIREVASRDYDADQVNAWAQADRHVWVRRRLDRPTWVALIDSAIAGFSDLKNETHIDMMFVHPAYQRMGVASALLDRVEREARLRHVSVLDTDASITARPFFETRGFRVVQAQRVDVRGVCLTNFRMQKSLIAV